MQDLLQPSMQQILTLIKYLEDYNYKPINISLIYQGKKKSLIDMKTSICHQDEMLIGLHFIHNNK